MKALLLAAAALIAAPLSAETIAITGGTVALGDGSGPIPNGTVIVTNGRVTAAGAGVAVPAGARVMDAKGKWVTPGIVGGISDLGIVDVGGVSETNDGRARTSPFSAAIDVADALDPTGQRIGVERTGGVTRVFVSADAGNTIFGGQGAFITLAADRDPLVKAHAFQYAELGEDASRVGGGTRLSAYALLRAALAAAKTPALASGLAKDALVTHADAAALVPVIGGQVPLLVHVERASDILRVLALKKEYPALKLVLVGVSEGWRVAPAIAAAHVPVLAGLDDLPAAFETLSATQSNIGRMMKAGVQVALSTIDTTGGGPQQKNLTQVAGNLVALNKVDGATGITWGQALAAITSKPAEAMGLGGQYGTLRAGAHGDVVVWDQDPLELGSAPVAVFIDGVQQPLTNRHTRLRDRYAVPQEGALPKAYEH